MIISKNKLAGAIKRLKGITPKMYNYGLLLEKGTLIARSGNMGVKLSLNIKDEDVFVIPPKALTMIENMPEGDIEITANGKKVTVKQGEIKSAFSTVSADAFPVTPSIKHNAELRIDGEDFISAVKKVAYAAAQGDCRRPILKSIYISVGDGSADFVASNGFRLARCAAVARGDSFTVAIPKDVALKACELLAADNEIIIYKSDRAAEIRNGSCEIYTQLLSGEYLNYQKILSCLGATEIKVNRQSLEDALKRAYIAIPPISKGGNVTPCKIRFDKDKLSIGAAGTDTEYTETLITDGEAELTIGFNTALLLEAVRALAGNLIKINVSGPTSPVVMRDDESIALVVPVRLFGD